MSNYSVLLNLSRYIGTCICQIHDLFWRVYFILFLQHDNPQRSMVLEHSTVTYRQVDLCQYHARETLENYENDNNRQKSRNNAVDIFRICKISISPPPNPQSISPKILRSTDIFFFWQRHFLQKSRQKYHSEKPYSIDDVGDSLSPAKHNVDCKLC